MTYIKKNTPPPATLKGKRGGVIPGQGRKKANHTVLAEEMRKMMIETLHARFKPMLEAQLDAAIGVTTEKFNRKTGDLYYQEEAPNTVAAKFMTEQTLGRPKETIEHSGEIRGLVGLITQLNNEGKD